MFIVAENTGSVNITMYNTYIKLLWNLHKIYYYFTFWNKDLLHFETKI